MIFYVTLYIFLIYCKTTAVIMTCHNCTFNRNMNKRRFSVRLIHRLLISKDETGHSWGSLLKIKNDIKGFCDEFPNISKHLVKNIFIIRNIGNASGCNFEQYMILKSGFQLVFEGWKMWSKCNANTNYFEKT